MSRPRLAQSYPARLIRYMRTLAWASASARRARRQLRSGNLASVTLPPAPLGGRGAPRGLRDGLALTRPSCLERSLVRRAWHLGQGRDIRIVIGVRQSSDGFGAHAWLQGDPPDPLDFTELLVWPGE